MEAEITINAKAIRTAHALIGGSGLRDWAFTVAIMERSSLPGGSAQLKFRAPQEFTLSDAHAAGDPDALEAARLLECIVTRASTNPHARAKGTGDDK